MEKPALFVGYRMANSPTLPALDLPAGCLSHLNHAFARIDDRGMLVSGFPAEDFGEALEGDAPAAHDHRWEHGQGNLAAYLRLKARHPALRTLISVGGWEWSRAFSPLAAERSSRKRLVESCVDFMLRYGFDGLDIDWEYPNAAGHPHNLRHADDPVHYIALIEDLRETMERRSAGSPGIRHILTAATSASPRAIPLLDMARLAKAFDFVNIMSYDFVGEWSSTTGCHAALHDPDGSLGKSGAAAVEAHQAAGMPAGQITLGLPFYGRQWRCRSTANGGMGQEIDKGSPVDAYVGWREIKAAMDEGEVHQDAQRMASWLCVREADSCRVISYDSPEILADKCAWVKAAGLAGVAVWELGCDPDNEMARVIARALGRLSPGA